MQESQPCAEEGDVKNVTLPKMTFITPTTSSMNLSEQNFLFQIPLELLGELLDKYIPHEDKLGLRLVHPFFQTLFDTYIGFKVTLDTDDPGPKLDFISELAIRKTTIQNLTSQPPKPFHEIFLYPQLLQEVIVNGVIDAVLLNGIVRHCVALKNLELVPGSSVSSGQKGRRNLKRNKNKAKFNPLERCILPEVDILSSHSSSECQSSQQDVHYLTKLRTIKLLMNHDPDEVKPGSRPPDLNTEAVLAIMKSLRSVHLERVVIQGWISDRFSVARLTLIASECLLRNPHLDSFFLGVIYEHLIGDEDPVPESDMELRAATLENLKKAGDSLNISKFGISTQSSDLILWKEFLKRQHNLVHISFTVDLMEGVFSRDMFRSCTNSLKQFILRGKYLTSFDFSWVEDCSNLKEICLHNIDRNHDQTSELAPLHAINPALIPDGLESLVLFGTTLRSDDIRTAVRNLRLKTLVLFQTGSRPGQTGVDVECLKIIFRCRTLESILMVRFVALNTVEGAELVTMLRSLNNGHIHREVAGADEIQLLTPGQELTTEGEDDEPPPLIEDTVSETLEVPGESLANEESVQETTSSDSQKESKVKETIQREMKVGAVTVAAVQTTSQNSARRIAVPDDLLEQLEPPPNKPTGNIDDRNKCIKPAQKYSNSDLKHGDDSVTNSENCSTMEPNLLPETLAENHVGDVNENDTPLDGSSTSLSHPVLGEPKSADNEISKTDSNANPTVSESFDIDVDLNVDMDREDVTDETPTPDAHDLGDDDDDDSDHWEDIESDTYDSDEDEGIFDLDLGDLNLEVLEQVAEAQALGGGPAAAVMLNVDNEHDLEIMLGMLEPVGQNGNFNNLQLEFIIDGVVDIQGPDTKRSRWVAVDGDNGRLSYTLKISID